MGDDAGKKAVTPAQSLTMAQALELAVGLHKNGLLDAAEELYGRILAAAPEHPDALHFAGMARHQRGAFDDAIALVRRAVTAAPAHVDARNNLGNMLLARGDLAGAEAEYREALSLRPAHADAHANLGIVLRQMRELAAAEDAFRRALEIDPEHGEAHHNLGSILRDTDRPDEALDVFQRALTLRPYDGESYRRVGATLYAVGRVADAAALYRRWLALEPGSAVAQHLLAACSGEAVPARASDEYVQRTFDSFADSFDTVLERLEYRAPALVVEALGAALGPAAGTLDVLDAGAGTGLCGPGLRPFARRLVGVDLSPRMLGRAETRGCYDALEAGELGAYMHARPAAFDVVVSADTLVYFGALDGVFAAAATTVRAGGHLVFTIERLDGDAPEGFLLHPHGRYAHAEPYVRVSLEAAGFSIRALTPVHLRLEGKRPVPGLVVVARRLAAP